MTLFYPYKKTRSDEELRYSLRSVCRNLPHTNVLIIGDKPDWLVNTGYLKITANKNKQLDQWQKLILALDLPALSQDFVLMNDDFFVMRQVAELPKLNRGSIQSVLREIATHGHARGDYRDGMIAAEKILQQTQGIVRPVSFELHLPMQFNKIRLMAVISELWGQLEYLSSVQIRTLYGNIVYGNIGEMNDVKVRSGQRDWPRGTAFLSTDNNSFNNGAVGQYIKDTFTEKCKYER